VLHQAPLHRILVGAHAAPGGAAAGQVEAHLHLIGAKSVLRRIDLGHHLRGIARGGGGQGTGIVEDRGEGGHVAAGAQGGVARLDVAGLQRGGRRRGQQVAAVVDLDQEVAAGDLIRECVGLRRGRHRQRGDRRKNSENRFHARRPAHRYSWRSVARRALNRVEEDG